jgi:formamidopyrimidine-DNA glycosylase
MPELPDVERFKRYLDATALHKRIREVGVRDTRILSEVSPRRLAGSLRGRELFETARHGKHLFSRIKGNGWLRLHFGMTGTLQYYKVQEEPEHVRLLLDLANGYHLAYVCQRRLGSIGLVDSVEGFISEAGLGPDALDRELSLADFRARLGERPGQGKGMIKSALMDQGKVAGMGNIASDEILFQAGIHPEKRVRELGNEGIRAVYRQMRRVLRKAASLPEGSGLPTDRYLTPHRKTDGACPLCGGKIRRETVCGRTAYYCPSCQS